MGHFPRATRARIAVLLAVLVAPSLAGCIIERATAWTPVTVSNESDHDVVIRRGVTKWLFKPGEAGLLEPVLEPMGADHLDHEIIDGTTCSTVTTVSVPVAVGSNDGSLITVPASGPPVVGPTPPFSGTRPRDVLPAPVEVCPGPEDGWALWVTNDTPEAYVIIEYQSLAPRGNAKIEPGESALLSGTHYGANQMPGSGRFVLLDSACHVVQDVDHGDFGTFIGTIESGKLVLESGPIPADQPNSWGSPWICPPK